MMRVRSGLASCLAAAAWAAAAPAALAAPEVTGHAGRWLTDSAGRVVIIHGVDVSSKGYARSPAFPSGIGFGAPDAQLLADNGFNAVRITFERYAFEPNPGQFDYSYLAHIRDTIKLLQQYGIYSLIDFHQDDYGPVFNDNGFPSWMTITDGMPNLNSLSFPSQYFANPALWHAFDHFWSDSEDPSGHGTLQADDIEILTRAVADLRGTSGLLGFEILNEPFPGSNYAACVNLVTGCSGFEQKQLSRYYDRVVKALRQADTTDMIWYEPQVGFDFGAPTTILPPADHNLGFSYHDYCLAGTVGMTVVDDIDGGSASPPAPTTADLFRASCAQIDQQVQTNALRQVNATGNALLETEWGDVNDQETLTSLANLYDADMVPWMYWVYNTGVIATGGAETIPPGPRHVAPQVLGALVRAYPQAISGTPTSWAFDPSTTTFDVHYSTERAAGRGRFPAGSQTLIYMPPRQYPSGYKVTVTGGTALSASDAATLIIASDPGARQVTVHATPR